MNEVLTERQRKVLIFALSRFINDAYARAKHAAYKGPDEAVPKFLDDAKTAEELVSILSGEK